MNESLLWFYLEWINFNLYWFVGLVYKIKKYAYIILLEPTINIIDWEPKVNFIIINTIIQKLWAIHTIASPSESSNVKNKWEQLIGYKGSYNKALIIKIYKHPPKQ